MKALIYLLWRTICNGLRELLRKPAVLIPYLLLAGLLIFSASSSSDMPVGEVRNLGIYAAIVNGVFLLIFCASLLQGLKQGMALFSMADVNLLFTSPVNPRKILVYGVARQAGILVLASVCMLAQYPNLRNGCGLGGEAVAGLMLGYIFVGVFCQLLSANLYALCAAHPQWRKRIDAMLKGFMVLLAVGVVVFAMRGGDVFSALIGFFGSDAWNYVPALGFDRAIALYSAVGQWGMALLYVFLSLLCCGAMVLWLVRSDADYYEDVLFAAEHAYNVKAAAKEGKVVSTGTVSKRVKRELAPLRGHGASAFFYRAMREQSRKSLWLFSLSTIAALAGPIFGAFMLRAEGPDPDWLWFVLFFSAYMLVFLSMTNSVPRELTQHYLFIVPAWPVAKLAAICAPQLIKHAADTVVFLLATALLLHPTIPELLGAGLFYLSLGAVFASGMLLIERLLGKLKSKVLIILLYFTILILLVLPGAVAAILISGAFSVLAGCALGALWNVLISLLILFCCRGLLSSIA